jgi:hypothetical protein
MFCHDNKKTTIQTNTGLGIQNSQKSTENALFSDITAIYVNHCFIISVCKNKIG